MFPDMNLIWKKLSKSLILMWKCIVITEWSLIKLRDYIRIHHNWFNFRFKCFQVLVGQTYGTNFQILSHPILQCQLFDMTMQKHFGLQFYHFCKQSLSEIIVLCNCNMEWLIKFVMLEKYTQIQIPCFRSI